MENIKLFIKEYKNKYDDKTLSYKAGYVYENGDISQQQRGAEETFSIGMPVYDENNNELGRLSIRLFKNLNYDAPGIDIKIPVESWMIDGYKGKAQPIKTFYQKIKSSK